MPYEYPQPACTTSMILLRPDLERREHLSLAPYAVRSEESRGRRHPEAADRYRTAFQRDRDRVIHSSAYRRLGNKTQVFVNTEGEYYRTRLTHTEEATQIALTVARGLGLNPELTEAICRAHDLGHAPFGHAGERALDRCMGGDGGFEHNAHTQRIVDLLEREYPDFPGLNLSWEVREGIAMHGDAAARAADLDDLAPRCADDIRSHPQPLASFSPPVQALRDALHSFLTAHLYRHYHVETMWVKAQRLIAELFASLDDAPAQLPPAVQERIGREGTQRRIICDYIAEMTDRTAVQEHRRLFHFDLHVLP